MKNFSIPMLALASCLFTQEAHAQSKTTAKPTILEDKTWTWQGSKDNYAKYNDLVFEVGMGNERNGVGCGDAGIEIENVGKIKLSVDASPVLNRLDANSFAGFMVDYSTAKGYTKRVALSIGVYSENRMTKTPIWGKFTTPDQFVYLGRKNDYHLDLMQWAPNGWNGKVWFVVTLQNTGRNTTLKAKAELLDGKIEVAQKPKEEPAKTKNTKDTQSKVVGIYHMLVPAGIIKLQFTDTNKFIYNGKDNGIWSVKGEKVIIDFGQAGFGSTELTFKDENTLVGVREFRSGDAILARRNWEMVREGTEAAAALASRAKGQGDEPKKESTKKEVKLVLNNDGLFHELGRLPGRSDTPGTIAISSDGKLLASGGLGQDHRIYVTELISGKTLHTLESHTSEIKGLGFSADSKSLFSGSGDGSVREWDMTTGREKRVLVEPVTLGGAGIALNKKDMTIATIVPGKAAALDGRLNVGDRLTAVSGHDGKMVRVQDTPLEQIVKLMSGEAGTTVILEVIPIGEQKPRRYEIKRTPLHALNRVLAMKLSSDGKTLAVGCTYRTEKRVVPLVRILESGTGKELAKFQTGTEELWELAFSPDGKLLVGAGHKVAKVWEVASGKELAELKGHKGLVCSAAFSLDGKSLVTVGTDKSVKLWKVPSWDEKPNLTEQMLVDSSFLTPVMFSPDGRLLAVGGIGNTVRIWDNETGNKVKEINLSTVGSGGGIVSLAFTSDSSLLAFGSSWDRRVHLFGLGRPGSVAAQVAKGKANKPLLVVPQEVSKIDYSKGPHGDYLHKRIGMGADLQNTPLTTQHGFLDESGVFIPHGRRIFWPTSEKEKFLFSNVIGHFSMSCAEIPRLESFWEFTKDGRAMQDGNDMGDWKIEGSKTVITYTNKQFGLAVLGFGNDFNTLAGKNTHSNGTVFNWVLKRGKLQPAQWYEPMKSARQIGEDFWYNGKLHGIRTWQYSSGEKDVEIPFINGKEHGTVVRWFESGKKREETEWADGKPHGKTSLWYENGRKSQEGTHTSGKPDGSYTSWYNNGNKKQEGTYKAGQNEGEWTSWYENGQVHGRLTYSRGILDLNNKDSCILGYQTKMLQLLITDRTSSGVPEDGLANYDANAFRFGMGEPKSKKAAGAVGKEIWAYKCGDGEVRLLVEQGGGRVLIQDISIFKVNPITPKMTLREFKEKMKEIDKGTNFFTYQTFLQRFGEPASDVRLLGKSGQRIWTYELADGRVVMDISLGFANLRVPDFGDSDGITVRSSIVVTRFVER